MDKTVHFKLQMFFFLFLGSKLGCASPLAIKGRYRICDRTSRNQAQVNALLQKPKPSISDKTVHFKVLYFFIFPNLNIRLSVSIGSYGRRPNFRTKFTESGAGKRASKWLKNTFTSKSTWWHFTKMDKTVHVKWPANCYCFFILAQN